MEEVVELIVSLARKVGELAIANKELREANERLKKVDISKIETLVAPLQKNIYDILSKAKTIEVEEKKQSKKKKKSSFYDEGFLFLCAIF